MISAQP